MGLIERVSTYVRDSKYDTSAHDAISNASPALARIMKKKVQPCTGENITWTPQISYAGRIQSGAAGYVVPLKQSEVHQLATVPSEDILQPIQLSNNILKRNAKSVEGDKMLSSYIDARVMNAINEMKEYIGRSLYSDGTPESNAEGGIVPNLAGMGIICKRDNTYAGLSPALYPSWQPAELIMNSSSGGTWAGFTFSGTAPTFAEMISSTDEYYLPGLLDVIIDYCTFGSSMPDLITCGPLYHSFLHRAISNKEQVVKGSFGFPSFTYRGISVEMDKLCPAGEIYVWTTETLGFGAVPGQLIQLEEGGFERVGKNTDYVVNNMLFSGNLVCTDRRKNGRLSGLSTTLTVS